MIDNIRPEGKIVKAAIIFNDKIYTGWRHSDIRDDIRNLVNPPRLDLANALHDPWKCGFVTENGRFLTRKQALTYGMTIGQINEITGSVLTSEDLWDNQGNPLDNA
jgi:hypothetical protein